MRLFQLYSFLFLILLSCSKNPSELTPVELKCEYLSKPIGIDSQHPRLSWKIKDKRLEAKQYAYQIFVGTDSSAISNGVASVWNSKKIISPAMLVSFEGKPLKPFTKYYWSVQVWDKDRKASSIAEPVSFETGMLNKDNWKGSWISDSEDEDLKPAPYFRKTFTSTKNIESARAYITAGGLYELHINGKRVGDHQLDPMYTRFDRRNLYVTYDVTNLIQEKNALGVLLGNGWYNHQSTAVWNFHKAGWRARPRFCMDLRIVYEDGSIETISTNKEWKTALSPVVFNSIYTAEHYDARLEKPGWDRPDFDDEGWRNSIIAPAPSQNIVAQTMHPIRHVEELPPISMREVNSQKYIYDLGRNISGVSRIRVEGAAGTTLKVTHSELLDELGNIDQSNIDLHYRPTDNADPFQTDIYVLKGEGLETFTPRFNYKGFQYIEVVSSQPIELKENSVSGIFMHSDVPQVGKVNSSNETLNKIWEATNSSYLANLFGYPTDCPQREKNGWTGDAHIAIETGLYNYDGITIYEKWIADHRDEQQANGVLPSIIPTGGWGYQWGNGPDWTSSIAIIPWNIYLFYGDLHLLEITYENIKRYVDHISEISPNQLTDWGLGDWVPVKSKSPREYTSSIYYFVDALILSKTADLLGKTADHEKYSRLSKQIKNAINEKYFDQEKAIYGSGYQTELSAALFWDIVPDGFRDQVAENLANRVIADGKHIDVGLLGSKTILNGLSENGYPDLAYEVASQETYPSWGWWIVNGATTLLENWNTEAKINDISMNHIMFGEIGAWYYKALGGIKPDPAHPGFKQVNIEPHFVKGLEYFESSHIGPFGEIISSWRRKEGKVYFSLTIPPNSSAAVRLKGNKISENNQELTQETADGVYQFTLPAGVYEFIIEE